MNACGVWICHTLSRSGVETAVPSASAIRTVSLDLTPAVHAPYLHASSKIRLMISSVTKGLAPSCIITISVSGGHLHSPLYTESYRSAPPAVISFILSNENFSFISRLQYSISSSPVTRIIASISGDFSNASSEYAMTGFPSRSMNCFFVEEPIRRPLPAASTIAVVFIFLLLSATLLPPNAYLSPSLRFGTALRSKPLRTPFI